MGYSHGTSWDNNSIEKAIKQFIDTEVEANNDFPSSELLRKKHRTDLSNAITRSGGFIYWRNKMGYKLKECKSEIGWHGEKIIEEILINKGYKVHKESTMCIYDYTVNDCVRVDCKYSRVYHGKQGDFFSCKLKNAKDCDIFIVLCEYDNHTYKILVIPHMAVFNQSQISIGLENSKWDCYRNKFHYIDKYENFYKNLIKVG